MPVLGFRHERPKMAMIITEAFHVFISEESLQGQEIPEFQLKPENKKIRDDCRMGMHMFTLLCAN